MNLVICGDSFMSADTEKPGTHFSELLTAYGHSVINLARGGISNVGIAFQLETATQLKPDAVIFSSTSSDRINIVVKNKKFYRKLGLKNFIYPYRSDLSSSSPYVGTLDAPIYSDVVAAFLSPRTDLPIELKNANLSESVKYYLDFFHDVDLQKTIDTWIIEYWKYKLIEKNIPFIHLHEGNKLSRSMYEYVRYNPDKITQAVYHTDEPTQIKVALDLNTELENL